MKTALYKQRASEGSSCLVPNGHSDFAAGEPVLHRSARDEVFANLPPDTSRYFETWLEALKPGQPADEVASSPDLSAAEYRPEESREIRFEGTLSVDGYIAGVVSSASGTLITTEASEIDADVSVNLAIIYGRVRGDIKAATRVELGNTARVIGDIETLVLLIQPGAVFEGRCTFLPDPHDKNVSDVTDADSVSSQDRPNTEELDEACEAIAAAAR